MSGPLVTRVTSVLRDAQEADARGRVAAAYQLYGLACELVIEVVRGETNPELVRVWEAQIERLFARLAALKPLLQRPGPAEEPGGAGGSASPTEGSGMSMLDTRISRGSFLIDRAADAEDAGLGAEALALYIEGAAAILEALKVAEEERLRRDPTHTSRTAPELEAIGRIEFAFLRGEEVKRRLRSGVAMAARMAALPMGGSGGADAGLPGASAGRLLDDEEKRVLRDTSIINGRVFLPWVERDRSEPFVFPTPFEDELIDLSTRQLRHFVAWKRPAEFLRQPTMIDLVSPHSITQELVPDCSFIASLCVAAAYELRSGKPLVTNIIFPQTREGRPQYNPSGKYMVRLHLNGVPRKVIVDDRFPVDRRNRFLCSFSSNPNELWVSIIEKAFLKACGSYAFPGSNSCKDLHVLTGWVPEALNAADEGFDRDRTWQRLLSGTAHRDCLVTIATPSLSEAEEERLGLVSSHAYAVLDVRDVSDGLTMRRLLMVKNPWRQRRWKGRYSPEDTASWTPALRAALRFDQLQAMRDDDGVFWIDYESVLTHFPHVYINWNPDLFPFTAFRHGGWRLTDPGPRDDTYNVGFNPQFRLRVDASRATAHTVLFLLVVRHVTRIDPDDEDRVAPEPLLDPSTPLASVSAPTPGAGAGALGGVTAPGATTLPASSGSAASASSSAGADEDKDFLALHIFGSAQSILSSSGGEGMPLERHSSTSSSSSSSSTSSSSSSSALPEGGDGGPQGPGERMFYPGGALRRGTYYNNPYTLTKLEFAPGAVHDATLVLSLYRRQRDIGFTIRAFAHCPVALEPIREALRTTDLVVGEWSGLPGVGNRAAPRFFDNPQFLLTVSEPTLLRLTIQHTVSLKANLRLFAAPTNPTGTPGATAAAAAAAATATVVGPDGGAAASLRVANHTPDLLEVASSGPYRAAFAYLLVRELPAGRYVVVPSTFCEGESGRFLVQAAFERGVVAITPLPPAARA